MESMFKEVLEGKFIILHKSTLSDAGDIYRWRSGVSGTYLRQPDNYSVEMQKEWMASRGNNEINYIISDKFSKEKVGTISIYDVNSIDKVANVGRLLVSDIYLTKSNPYGLEAMLMCYGYVFNTMQFRKITGDIAGPNVAMLKLQSYLGMKQEGLLVKHVLMNNKFEDLYIMSLFAEDFENKYIKRVNIFLRPFESK